MRAVWAALAAVDVGTVPSSPEVLLADDLGSWLGAPAGKSSQQLWTRLRVATLGAIWQVRCERDAGSLQQGVSLARRAATLALSSVEAGIWRDWARAGDVAPASLPSMCAAWFRGFDVSITLEAFKQMWATPAYFCEVQEQQGHQPQLVLRLGGPLCPPLPD
jgi:hypothetical protein